MLTPYPGERKEAGKMWTVDREPQDEEIKIVFIIFISSVHGPAVHGQHFL